MGKENLEKLNENIKNGKDINNIIEGMNEYFEKCENIDDAILILQKINDLFLTTYELKITDKNKEKAITISPLETEIYFSNKQCRDGMIHENERQKGHFGQLYFHRIKGWEKKGTDPIDIKSGGLDVCLSKSKNYCLSILIRSAYIKDILESGIAKISKELIKHMRIKGECVECLLKNLEKNENNKNVIIERTEKINIEKIFHQPRISGKNYSKTKYRLNSINIEKIKEIRHEFYTEKETKEILNYIMQMKKDKNIDVFNYKSPDEIKDEKIKNFLTNKKFFRESTKKF